MFTEAEIKQAQKTARSAGAVGEKAVVPRHVIRSFNFARRERILDFGAGKGVHAVRVAEAVGQPVETYDFGSEFPQGKFTLVYASNVLNVSSSKEMLEKTVRQLASLVGHDGKLVCNYPQSPRKAGLSPAEVKAVLESKFKSVIRVEGSNAAPVWEVRP